MLQVHKNEISLCKCSGGTAHLHTLKGTLVAAFGIWSTLMVNTYGTNKGLSWQQNILPGYTHPCMRI